jgi:hypothetical protein
LGGALEALNGKMVEGRRLTVITTNKVEELAKCHIFFGSAADSEALRRLIKALGGRPVLIVTDGAANFTQVGAIINLIPVDDKINFEINLGGAQRANLSISSQLLKLAKTVRNSSP